MRWNCSICYNNFFSIVYCIFIGWFCWALWRCNFRNVFFGESESFRATFGLVLPFARRTLQRKCEYYLPPTLWTFRLLPRILLLLFLDLSQIPRGISFVIIPSALSQKPNTIYANSTNILRKSQSNIIYFVQKCVWKSWTNWFCPPKNVKSQYIYKIGMKQSNYLITVFYSILITVIPNDKYEVYRLLCAQNIV